MNVSTLPRLKESDFKRFQRFIKEQAGIHMADVKKPLVEGRLSKRLAQLAVSDYGDYFSLVSKNKDEAQQAVNLLTTNETFFFREPKHFDFLAQHIAPQWKNQPNLRVWCGASSTGEEPYTLAMVLAEVLGHTRFEILASDISTRVLDTARRGLYPLEDAQGIPRPMRARYCLKGIGSQDGWFTLAPAIKSRINFEQINLNAPLPDIGEFDAVFLRNVMIYFSQDTKREVLARIVPRIKPGGYFVVSHSETLHGVTDALRIVRPSIYRQGAGYDE